MKPARLSFFVFAIVALFHSCSVHPSGEMLEEGVPLSLAQWRSSIVSDVEYDIFLSIPECAGDDIVARETVSFLSAKKADAVLDFHAPSDGDAVVRIGSEPVPARIADQHIIIPSEYIVKGRNVIDIEFVAGQSALNRREGYVYTLFVPDRARTVFPCFDQPDIKARFALTLEIPSHWKAVSNAPVKEEDCGYGQSPAAGLPELRDDRRRIAFTQSDPLPTYLFAFAAGEFEYQYFEEYGLGAYHRATDPAQAAQIPDIAKEVRFAIDWLEDYTGMPYPFAKYDFVLLPGFQFGGMEHAGATFYNDTRLLLSANPTPDEVLRRLELIAHETAHMWFGDAVTMKWFNDVWTKEVFANYFAAEITAPMFPQVNHELNFLRTYKAAAMAQDRTEGRTAIRQGLDNMNNAGLVYNDIIYNKAPVMMRKLASMMGPEAFRDGIREYLATFKYGNATWDDLVEILAAHTDADMKSFSRQWVDYPYWPEYQAWSCSDAEDFGTYGFIRLTPVQADSIMSARPLGNALSPEAAAISLPSDPVRRLALLMNLNENYLKNVFTDSQWLDFLIRTLEKEEDTLIAATIAGYMSSPLMRMSCFCPGTESQSFEAALLKMAGIHHILSVRTLLLRLLAKYATSGEVVGSLYAVWSEGKDVRLSQSDFMMMAYELAVRLPEQADAIVSAQKARLSDPDVISRFDFISRAVNPSESYRDSLFDSLSDPQQRKIEPWTQSVLYYLNHPLRNAGTGGSVKYIRPALELLPEIQRTGDIFFPSGWCSNLLAGHLSEEAYDAVHQYLDEHKDLNPMLRSKILQASFNLDRTFGGE